MTHAEAAIDGQDGTADVTGGIGREERRGRRDVPGGAEPARSLMAILSGRRAPEGEEPNITSQMPPLVSHAVDVQGHKLLEDWIAALPPCP